MTINTDKISKKQIKDTHILLPPMASLETTADITDTLEAVERFPACVLLTEPIPSYETDIYTVKEIVFKIKSNDQGWSSEDSYEGVYENSQTWFEVAILRQVEGDVKISPRKRPSNISEPCIKKALEEKNISDKLCFVLNPQGSPKLWHLQRNRRGNDKPFVHTIIWTRNCEEMEDARLLFEAKTGAGSGVDFVRSLQKGDRVAVIARAKQSGSVNYVSAAAVQISFEGLTPDSNPSTAGSTNDFSITRSNMHALPSSSERRTAQLWTSLQISKVAKAAGAARAARVAKAAKKVMKAAKAAKIAKFMKAVKAAKVVKAGKAGKQ